MNITSATLLGLNDHDERPEKAPKTFNYWTRRLSMLDPEFEADMRDHTALKLSESTQTNLWMNKAGIITHTHYDAQVAPLPSSPRDYVRLR